MWKFNFFILLLVTTFNYQLTAEDSITVTESMEERLYQIKTNQEKIEMISEYKWNIKTTHINFEELSPMELRNDTLFFLSKNYYRGDLIGKVPIAGVMEISYEKASWKYPFAILGGIAGIIGGGYLGASAVGLGTGDFGGLGTLMAAVAGAVAGGAVGGTIGWFLGDMAKITENYDYSSFNLAEKRYMINNEIFPIPIFEKGKKDDNYVKLNQNIENQSSVTDTLVKEKNENSVLLEPRTNNDTLQQKKDLFKENQRTRNDMFLGLEYNGSINLTLLAGYIPYEQMGFEFGYSSPDGKANVYLKADYYFQNTDIEKHILSGGIANINTTVGYCCADPTAYHWVNQNYLVCTYKYSFYGMSIGMGYNFPIRRLEENNFASFFLTLGYRYYF
ncbi:hypothetical protein D9V86_03050 [Bacteroidetes/Chlorobi group bacterium ChocPot_Mid]|nr:MAG: hypothetical protein D9V86_03050 [Bacteroidetes/Chlorobi group bacterium ChocPot_Mid]